jgi:hypothetical protein
MRNPEGVQDEKKREFLKKALILTGGTFLFGPQVLQAGCSPEQPTKSRTLEPKLPATGIRREPGEWSEKEKMLLADQMVEQSDFPNIVRAGVTLFTGRQNDALGLYFPESSRILISQEVKIENIQPEKTKDVASAVIVDKGTQQFEFVYRLDNFSNGIEFIPEYLQLEQIRINNNLANELSDFAIIFGIAEAVKTVHAAEHATELACILNLLTLFKIPENDNIKKGLTAATYEIDLVGIPVKELSKIFAKFLMAPEYMLAVQNEKFSEQDKEILDDPVYTRAFETFKSHGILKKDSKGNYRYRWADRVKVLKMWTELAQRIYFGPDSPQIPQEEKPLPPLPHDDPRIFG